jgi:hypothetical protein
LIGIFSAAVAVADATVAVDVVIAAVTIASSPPPLRLSLVLLLHLLLPLPLLPPPLLPLAPPSSPHFPLQLLVICCLAPPAEIMILSAWLRVTFSQQAVLR